LAGVAYGQSQLNPQDEIVESLMDSDFLEVSALEGCEDVTVRHRERLAGVPNARAVDVECGDSTFDSAGLTYFVFQSDEEALKYSETHSSDMAAIFDMSTEFRDNGGLEYLILFTSGLPLTDIPAAMAFASQGTVVVMSSVSGESSWSLNRYMHLAEDLVVLGVEELGGMGDPVA
jgi:hypothetical protein